jgi:hypothetical protein
MNTISVDEEALKDAVSAYAHMVCASEFGGFLLVEPEWMRAAITAYLAVAPAYTIVNTDDLQTMIEIAGWYAGQFGLTDHDHAVIDRLREKVGNA